MAIRPGQVDPARLLARFGSLTQMGSQLAAHPERPSRTREDAEEDAEEDSVTWPYIPFPAGCKSTPSPGGRSFFCEAEKLYRTLIS